MQACSKVSTDESDFGSTLSSTGSSGINIFSSCNFHYCIVLIEVHFLVPFNEKWLVDLQLWAHFSGTCFDVLYNLNLSRI